MLLVIWIVDSQNELFAVSEWLDTNEPVHSMRDHPWHITTMLGEEYLDFFRIETV